jgi:hypothetical protein
LAADVRFKRTLGQVTGKTIFPSASPVHQGGLLMTRFCGTRAIKNAKFIRSVAPHIIPAKEPLEGFASLVPIDILRRFHRMKEADLRARPDLLDVLKKLHAQKPKTPTGPKPSPRLFGDSPFRGTLHFAKITFFQEANGARLSVNDADLATAIRYMTLAAPAVSAYCSQYGTNRIDVSATVLQFGIAVTSGLYNDDAVQNIVNDIVRQHNLPHDSSCIVIINPPGMLNTDADPKSVLGYHDKADATYCFINALSFPFTVEDRADSYAASLTHEVAEMVCDPDDSIFNDEVCDGCDTNCNKFTWRNFFLDPSPSLANSFIEAANSIPAGLKYSYFITGIARPDHADDCPASQSACA